MLGAFVDLCGLRGTWQMADFVDRQLADIRAKCGTDRSVFVLVPGGVEIKASMRPASSMDPRRASRV